MEINRQVEDFIKSLLACLQVGKIYTRQHPRFEEYILKCYNELSVIFMEREEIVVGIVEDEFVFEQEIFFDLSKKARAIIDYLKAKEVERLAFYRQISKDEIVAFVDFLLMPPEDKSISADKYLLAKGIQHIVMGKIKISSEKAKEISQSVDYLSHYHDSMDNVAKSFGMVLDSQSVDALELKFTVANIMENLVGRYLEFFKLAVVKEYDVATFTHVLNVSILSMYFAARLGFSKDDCIEIGIAALFSRYR